MCFSKAKITLVVLVFFIPFFSIGNAKKKIIIFDNFYPFNSQISDSISFSKIGKNYFKVIDSLIEFKSYKEAAKNLESIDTLAESELFKNTFYKVHYLYLLGKLHFKKRNFEISKIYFNQVHFISKSLKNDSILVLTIKSLGNIQFINSNYDSALIYYSKAISIEKSKQSPSNTLLASLYQNLGISLSMVGKNDSALKYLRKSLNMKENFLSSNDPVLAKGFLNFARFLQLTGELENALSYIEKAEAIYFLKYGDNDPVLAPLYFNKGAILLSIRDYESALQYHEKALTLYQNELNLEDKTFSQLYLNFGAIYSYLGDFSKAINYYKKCLDGNANVDQKIKAYLQMGRAYFINEDVNSAGKYFSLALDISIKNLGIYNILTANCYLNYGLFAEKIHDLPKAFDNFSKSANIFKTIFGNKARDLSNTLTYLGNHFFNRKIYSQALNYYQEAIVAYIDSFNDSSIYSNPEPALFDTDLNLFYTLSGKAEAFYGYYRHNTHDPADLEFCLETADLAIGLFEKIKATLTGENTKLIITNQVSDIYDLAINTASELYFLTGEHRFLEASFRYTEKSKAAVLLSTIKESEALEIGNIPPDIKETEQRLKRRIAQYQTTIYDENQKQDIDSAKVARIKDKLFNTQLHYDSLVSALEENYPFYYNLKYNFDVVSTGQVRNRLEKDQSFIQYKLVDSLLFTYIVNRDTIALIRNDVGSGFKDEVNTYLSLINQLPQADSVRQRSYAFATLGRKLTGMLELDNPLLDGTENLIIIPDDILGYLSFDALVEELPEKERSDYRRLSYLIRRFNIAYDYSGTLFFNTSNNKKPGRRVLAMAPTYEAVSLAASNGGAGTARDLQRELIPLKYTEEEVGSIAEVFRGKTLTGEQATESSFKQLAGSFNILHFAMHTLIDDDEPLNSRLVFTLGNDTVDDGFLNTYEIYNLDLNARLAVLSACKTGTGKLSKGEGIMSLARGFIYAGVPSIVMTLWSIEDVSGSTIIADFYKALSEGRKKDVALRNAKMNYLGNANPLQAHPYFWAAYVYIGDNEPLPGSGFPYGYAAIPLVLAAGFMVYWLRRRKKTPRPA